MNVPSEKSPSTEQTAKYPCRCCWCSLALLLSFQSDDVDDVDSDDDDFATADDAADNRIQLSREQ